MDGREEIGGGLGFVNWGRAGESEVVGGLGIGRKRENAAVG